MHSAPELTSTCTLLQKIHSRIAGCWLAPVALAFAVFNVPTTAGAQAAYEVVAFLDGQAPNGAVPRAGLIQATDGSFYGTTYYGGAFGYGTVFKVDSAGTLETLHSFSLGDGAWPRGGLIQRSDQSFYGTTSYGPTGYGTVFKLDATGALTTLHVFSGHDGAYPHAGLIQTNDGSLYGTTSSGGAFGQGTVFRIADGTMETRHNFSYSDGASPEAGLIRAIDGRIYGTTMLGGLFELGTVFRLDAGGTLTTLHHFDGNHGAHPQAALLQGVGGTFYGTTASGGAFEHGTVFKISSAGTLTLLHSFAFNDGANPRAGLIQSTDGSLFGTTSTGGIEGMGTVFKLDSAGSLTLLHDFMGSDGAEPNAALIHGNDGSIYGMTSRGGPNDAGVIFRVTTLTPTLVARDDNYSTPEDAALVVAWPGVLANDSDADGNPLAAVLVSGPRRGALSLTPNGSFSYTPSPDYNGTDSFTYQVENGTGAFSTVATVAITVTTVNDAPVAQNGTASTTAGTPVSGMLLASDVEGNQLTYGVVTNGTKGTAIITNASTGAFVYTPNSGASGADTFTFTAHDGSLSSNGATITITITAPPVAPSTLTAAAQYSGAGKNKALLGVKLTWADNSTTETRFRIQRCQVTGKGSTLACTYSPTSDVTVAANATTYFDPASSLARGATYRYRVRSENAAGGSAWLEVQITLQ